MSTVSKNSLKQAFVHGTQNNQRNWSNLIDSIYDAKDNKSIESSDDGATGPSFSFEHITTSPAVADVIGKTLYKSTDSAGNDTTYVSIGGAIESPTSDSEYGAWGVKVTNGGSFPDVNNFQVTTSGIAATLTDDGATGMALTLATISDSPAQNDEVGMLKFVGRNSNDDAEEYAIIKGYIDVVTDGSEAGGLKIELADGGDSETVIANFVCDAGTDKMGFFGVTPVAKAAHIADAVGDAVSEVNAVLVVLENLGFIATS